MNKILTNSALTVFKTCPRKYQIKYEMGISPVRDSAPLIFGKEMHRLIEEWLKAGRKFEMPANLGLGELEDSQILVRLVSLALMEGYHERYKEEEYETVAVEQKFEMPMVNPDTGDISQDFRLAGMKDAIYRDKKGYILIKETKTTSEDIEDPNSDYWKRLSIDSQISHYYLGAKSLGHNPKYCLYDVIRKPTIRQKKTETAIDYFERLRVDIKERPNFYYARREIPRSAEDLKDYQYDISDISKMIHSCQNTDTYPRFTNSCKTVFGVCSYFDFCTGVASLEDTSLFKRDENPHVELMEGA